MVDYDNASSAMPSITLPRELDLRHEEEFCHTVYSGMSRKEDKL
jgi:hypothetical protein